MEINADHYVMTPWSNHYPHMTWSPYLPTSLPGQHTHFDNLANLRFDQRPGFLNGARVHGEILKPKAIRITSLRPLVHPPFSERHTRYGLELEEFRCRNVKSTHGLRYIPGTIHEFSAYPNALYSSIPYLLSCPSSFSGPHSTFEAENMFMEMLRSQMQLLNYRETCDYKGPEEASFNAAKTFLGTSAQAVSATSSFLKENVNNFQARQASSNSSVSKYLPLPFKLIPKDGCVKSNLQESKRSQLYAQKLRQKALKGFRKHFMVPLTRRIKKETVKMKISESEKTNFKAESPRKAHKQKYLPEELSSLDGTPKSNISSASFHNVTANNAKSVRINNDTSIPINSLKYKGNGNASEFILIKSTCPENNEGKKTMENATFYLAQPGSLDDRKTFKCSQCRYLTDRKNNLKRHIVTMHQDSSKTLECCGVSFQNKAALRDHSAIFHRGGYRCQICSRNFCRKALLRRHLTVHSGQKDFFCNICGYATSHKSNLERHQKVHTKRETTAGTNRRGVSIKGGLRLGTGSSFSEVTINPREQHSFHRDCFVSSALPKYGSTIISSQTKDVVKHISQEADCSKRQKTYTFFNKRIKNTYHDKLLDIKNVKNRSLQNHTGMKISGQENYDAENLDATLQSARKEDGGCLMVQQEDGKNLDDNTATSILEFNYNKPDGLSEKVRHLF